MCTLNYLVRDCIVSDLRHRCWALKVILASKEALWFIVVHSAVPSLQLSQTGY